MYAKFGHPDDHYVAALYRYGNLKIKQRYALAFHYGNMPAYDSKVFDTIKQAKSWAKSELGITHWRGFNGQFTTSPE